MIGRTSFLSPIESGPGPELIRQGIALKDELDGLEDQIAR